MKKLVLSNKFFEKLIKEKVGNSKRFRISYTYANGELLGLEFKTDNYYASLRGGGDVIVFTERVLEDGLFKIVNTKKEENAKFHENSLTDLENILEDLAKQYPCINKEDISGDAINIGHYIYDFVNPNQ
jgi:hypothetical protein